MKHVDIKFVVEGCDPTVTAIDDGGEEEPRGTMAVTNRRYKAINRYFVLIEVCY